MFLKTAKINRRNKNKTKQKHRKISLSILYNKHTNTDIYSYELNRETKKDNRFPRRLIFNFGKKCCMQKKHTHTNSNYSQANHSLVNFGYFYFRFCVFFFSNIESIEEMDDAHCFSKSSSQ